MTALQIVDEIYQNILLSPLKQSILPPAASGLVYKYQRELNSRGEDIVINALPLSNGPVQTCIVNVNIYCPNIKLPLGLNKFDNTQPDSNRLAQLAQLAVASLTDVAHYNGMYEYTIQQQQLYTAEDNTEHFLNFRIEFFSQLDF